MKNIIITGTNGFIGQYLVNNLANYFPVIALTRQNKRDRIFQKNVRVSKTNYAEHNLKELFYDAYSVIHLAAKRYSPYENENYFDNLILDEKIFNAAVSARVRHLLYFSTIGVYGTSENVYKTEDSSVNPETEYALRKYQAENSLRYLFQREEMDYTILRVAQVLGHGERKGYFLNTIIENAKNSQPIRLTGSEFSRHLVYITDLLDVINKVLRNKEVLSGVYNVASDIIITKKKYAEAVVEQSNSGSEIIYHNYDKRILSYSMMKIDKICSRLDWKPGYNLKKAVSAMMAKGQNNEED